MDFKCKCKNIEIQSYENQISMLMPFGDEFITPKGEKGTWVCIDTCLVGEVSELWKKGIRTTGCCCGHNINTPYIGVITEDIQKMKDLGYKVQENPCRPGDEDSFYPKSLNNINITLNVVNVEKFSKIMAFSYETAIGFIKKVNEGKAKSKITYLRMLKIKKMIEEIEK